MPQFLTHDAGDFLYVRPPSAVPPLLPPAADAAHRPFWSVIVTVCDRTAFLGDCLRSILSQGGPAEEMEILLQDDRSAADMRSLAESCGAGRIRYVRNDARLGLYGNINRALRRSTGHWIHVLHDDDYVLPGFYSAMRSALSALPERVGMGCCNYRTVNDADGSEWSPPSLREGPGVVPQWLERLAVANPLTVPAVVFRRAAFERIGVFREDLPFTGDWDFYIRSAAGFDCWYVPETLAHFRLHAENQTQRLYRNGQAAADICRTLAAARARLPEARRPLALDAARRLHLPMFLHHAGASFGQGDEGGGVAWLRACVELDEQVTALPAFREILQHPLARSFRQQRGLES